ncbi:MAG: hypothetical protein AB1775_06295 [Bacteroidota bacterium]
MNIKNIRKKHKQLFPIIPFQFPIIFISLIGFVTFCYFFLTKADGLFINLIAGLICILITPYLVTYPLFKERAEEWKLIKLILNSRSENFTIWFYRNVAESIKINLIEHFGPIDYLTKNLNIKEIKKLLDNNLKTTVNQFSPGDLEIFINTLSKEKQNISGITSYMEKRPYFLHIVQLYEIEWILENITSKYLFYKITKQFKDDKTIIESNVDYTTNLISETNKILEILIKLNDDNKIE